MIRLLLFLLWLMVSNITSLIAQPAPDANTQTASKSTLASTAYPITALGEEHASFVYSFPLSDRFIAELQGFYDTYALGARFRTMALLRWKMNRKWSLVSGLHTESELPWFRRNNGQTRIGFVSGVEYQLMENILLDAKMDFQLNNASIGAFGEPKIKMPQIYTVGSKIKL